MSETTVEFDSPSEFDGLSRYTEPLADAVAQRAARYIRNAKAMAPGERWRRALTSPKSVQRLVGEASNGAQTSLALFAKLVHLPVRWDHARRLLACCGVEHPEAVMHALLSEGLLLLRRNGDAESAKEPIPRFEGVEQLPGDRSPLVELAPPLSTFVESLPAPFAPLEGIEATGWRQADGWDLPIRMGRIWRLADESPIKRTQQNELFKRDHDRISGDNVLTAPPIDAPSTVRDAGKLAFALFDRLGWLEPYEEGRRPIAPLSALWPDSLDTLVGETAQALIGLESWNELGSEAPVGAFHAEAPSARLFVLLLLDSLPENHGATVDDVAERLLKAHPLWTGVADPIGPLRQFESRRKLAIDWTTAFLLGGLYQSRAVEIAGPISGKGIVVRLTKIGKKILGDGSSDASPPPEVQTLLVQPNHQMIVYRQGLTTTLLAKLMLFADLKTAGPALAFEINADSVYGALESGLAVRSDTISLTDNPVAGRL